MTQIPDGLKFGKRNLKTRITVWNTFISNKEYKGNQGIYQDKIVGFLNFIDRMGIGHKLNQDELRTYQLFRKNANQKEETSVATTSDIPLPVSKKEKKRLAKQKEIAEKVLLALTDKDGKAPTGRGLFSVKNK